MIVACAHSLYAAFLPEAGVAERHLVQGGVRVAKFRLSVSRAQQRRRFRPRDLDALKQWTLSPVDFAEMDTWDDRTRAKAAMLVALDYPCAPWLLVSSDCKKHARLNLTRDLLGWLHDPYKNERVVAEVGRLLALSTKNLDRLPVGAPHGRR